MCRAFGAIITAVILIPAIGPAAAIHDVMDRLPRIGGTGYPNPGHECGGLNICLEGCESGGTCFDSGDGSAWVCTGAPYPASGCVMSGAEICGTNSLLVAHGENNNAFWALYHNRVSGRFEVSWSMTTTSLNNGADTWAFGMIIHDGDPSRRVYVSFSDRAWEKRATTCTPLHGTQWLGTFDSLIVYVQGVAAGWSGTHSCYEDWHWEVGGGLTWTLKGPAYEVSGRGGQSGGCSDGTIFDTELIFDDFGPLSYL